jgi:hypothetical protein
MHFLRSRGCAGSSSWFPDRARWTNVIGEWALSPLAVSGVPRSPRDEEARAFSTPCTVTGVRFE